MNKKLKKRMKLLFIKIPIILVIFALVMIGALKLVERYPEPLKEGFEKYLFQQTGARATIGQVDKVAFYPNIDIQLQNITLHRATNAALIDGEAGKFILNVPLSNLFIRKGRINALMAENLRANKGIFTAHDITIKSAEIKDVADIPDAAKLLVDGVYGGKDFNIFVDIKRDKKSYIVPKTLPFILTLGEYKLSGVLQKNLLDVVLKDIIFQKSNRSAPAQDYIFIEKQGYVTDNPLACLYQFSGDDLEQCDQYLESRK